VGEVGAHANLKELQKRLDEITQKFVMPALTAAHPSLKVAALKTAAEIARAIQKTKIIEGESNSKNNLKLTSVKLAHHNDLIVEAVECMKAKTWELKERNLAMETALELIRLPPQMNQIMRCSLLKACFTAVFPSLLNLYRETMVTSDKNSQQNEHNNGETAEKPLSPQLYRKQPKRSPTAGCSTSGVLACSPASLICSTNTPVIIHQVPSNNYILHLVM